jgi:hypothetical protein
VCAQAGWRTAQIELSASFAMSAVDQRLIAYEVALKVPSGERMPHIVCRLEYRAGSRIRLAIA